MMTTERWDAIRNGGDLDENLSAYQDAMVDAAVARAKVNGVYTDDFAAVHDYCSEIALSLERLRAEGERASQVLLILGHWLGVDGETP
jgi:hypothetical protein